MIAHRPAASQKLHIKLKNFLFGKGWSDESVRWKRIIFTDPKLSSEETGRFDKDTLGFLGISISFPVSTRL